VMRIEIRRPAMLFLEVSLSATGLHHPASARGHFPLKATRMNTQPTSNKENEEEMFEVTVPPGLTAGDSFIADVAGVQMSVQVPLGVSGGEKVRVAAPPSYTAQGRQLTDEELAQRIQQEEVAAAAGTSARARYCRRRGRHEDPALLAAPPGTVLVETEHVSPGGLLCCLIGCPFIFPFNLLGLLFTERRLTAVPVQP